MARKIVLTCPNCENDFETSITKPSKYCSMECFKAHKKSPNTKCAECGKEYHLKPRLIKRSKNNFCCIECHAKYKSKAMLGDGNHQFGILGEENASFSSDIRISNYGYILVRDIKHPFRNGSDFVLMHRVVLEEHLRIDEPDSEYLVSVDGYDIKYLDPDVIVHHKNQNKIDNRVRNLEIMNLGDHTSLHNVELCGRLTRGDDGRFVSTIGKVKKSGATGSLVKKHFQDAGLDIKSAEDCIVAPHDRRLIKTGIMAAIPDNHVGLVHSRSGLSVKHGIQVGAGCIDASYRGELGVILYNLSDKPFEVKVGDRIAQLLTIPINLHIYEEVDEIEDTERGSGGYGSTGVSG